VHTVSHSVESHQLISLLQESSTFSVADAVKDRSSLVRAANRGADGMRGGHLISLDTPELGPEEVDPAGTVELSALR